MGIQKDIVAKADRRPNLGQAIRASVPWLQGSEEMGMADQPKEGGVQPHLQPHDVWAE